MIMNEQQPISLHRKIKISLGLMGILPLFLVMYLAINSQSLATSTWYVGSALVLTCILLGFTLLRQSADQVHTLAQETALVSNDTPQPPINIDADGELKYIAENFNTLVNRLNHANRDLQDQSIQLLDYARDLSRSYEKNRQEEQLRNQLCRYISSDLVEELLASENGSLLRNQRKPVTVMFADIRSFTALAEKMEPEEVVAMLNQYFSRMVDIVFKYHGMLDKLVGDQLMAIFGHISDEPQGANDAVLAAMDMQNAVSELKRTRAAQKLLTFDIGIGINTGTAIFAHVGSENRKDYTVIGDIVNTAARLEKYAKGGEIIIGQRTCEHLSNSVQVEKWVELKVKNRSKPLVCYTIPPSAPDARERDTEQLISEDTGSAILLN